MCIAWVSSTEVCLRGPTLNSHSTLLSIHALDLHPGNIVLVDQAVSKQSTDDILRSMCSPLTALVQAAHGKGITSHLPQYLVLPSTLPLPPELSNNCRVKIIDFGSAFLSGDPSPKMRSPLPYRAPEAVMTGSWDAEADIWSLGCTVRRPATRVPLTHN